MLFTDIAPQAHFLADAAHLLATASPEASAFLMSRRNKLMVDNDIAIPDAQRQRVCSCCGHIMVPGHGGTALGIETDKARRSSATKSEGKRPGPGGITKVMTCGHCARDSRVKLDGPSRISRPRKKQAQSSSAISSTNHQAPEPSSAKASSKKRAKNRKAGLQALLDQKQAAAASSKSGFGLSLADFIKK